MSKRYFETRNKDRLTPEVLLADVMRHFYARQQVGRAVVICEDPEQLVGLAQRQWRKLSRTLQRRRGAATNAVEILKYTYNITQMQRLRLLAEAPHEEAEAGVFFVRPQQLRLLPPDCLTVYLTCRVQLGAMAAIMLELPASGLVVDYCGQIAGDNAFARPKIELERTVQARWAEVEDFLRRYRVDMRALEDPAARTIMMDEAVDELLEADQEFLGLARRFQRALDMARPLQAIAKAERDRYDTFMLLAHRVQTLAPDGFTTQFLGTYADDVFYLSDNRLPVESLAEAVKRHELAGRRNLARALMRLQPTRKFAFAART
jgi:hypothetical protein